MPEGRPNPDPSGSAGSARLQATFDEIDARRGPQAPSLGEADRVARSAYEAYMDACEYTGGLDAMGTAAIALKKARDARDSILDGLSEAEWGALVAAGYTTRDAEDWE